MPFLEESESDSDDYSEPAAVSRDAKKGMYTIIIRGFASVRIQMDMSQVSEVL